LPLRHDPQLGRWAAGLNHVLLDATCKALVPWARLLRRISVLAKLPRTFGIEFFGPLRCHRERRATCEHRKLGATPDHAARVDVATDLPPSQLDPLTAQTVSGAALLGVASTGSGARRRTFRCRWSAR
jgi:hypothetical protein